MTQIILRDALYTPFAADTTQADIATAIVQMRTVLRTHTEAIGTRGQHSYLDAGHHYVCSTMMDSVFSAAAMSTYDLLDNAVPHSFTHAYECACWGYCLRYHMQFKPSQRWLVISILDVNAMAMAYWTQNEQWGKSGFGITTLCFELVAATDAVDGLEPTLPVASPAVSVPMQTGMASGGNNIISFASMAKQATRDLQCQRLSLPFFPDSMSIPVRRSLKDLHVLTERHAHYGHAFGSDPWLAFICDQQHSDLGTAPIVFGSLALRGYYCFADITPAQPINTQHFPLVC